MTSLCCSWIGVRFLRLLGLFSFCHGRRGYCCRILGTTNLFGEEIESFLSNAQHRDVLIPQSHSFRCAPVMNGLWYSSVEVQMDSDNDNVHLNTQTAAPPFQSKIPQVGQEIVCSSKFGVDHHAPEIGERHRHLVLGGRNERQHLHHLDKRCCWWPLKSGGNFLT